MTLSKGVLGALLKGVANVDDLLGSQGLMKALKVRLTQRMLGYAPEAEPAKDHSNRRNGRSGKTLKGNDGALPVDVSRDRDLARDCGTRMAVHGLFC